MSFKWEIKGHELNVEAVEQLLNPFVVASDHGQPPLAEATVVDSSDEEPLSRPQSNQTATDTVSPPEPRLERAFHQYPPPHTLIPASASTGARGGHNGPLAPPPFGGPRKCGQHGISSTSA